MIFEKTKIRGAFLIKREPNMDARGYFARLYCEKEFTNAGIVEKFVQTNICVNEKRGTLRGMHYQTGVQEGKLVVCSRGKIWDVFVDLRRDSATYLQYVAEELSEDNGYMFYIPRGCAHGYVTLEENSQLIYQMTEFFIPGNDAGYRFDDPAFGIDWPIDKDDIFISEKDRKLPYINN